MKLIFQLSTNTFKVDFFFNILEICEAKFLQESSEVSKTKAGRYKFIKLC